MIENVVVTAAILGGMCVGALIFFWGYIVGSNE